ncbi:MAG: hypothetical protein R3F60_27365 [bacterium]
MTRSGALLVGRRSWTPTPGPCSGRTLGTAVSLVEGIQGVWVGLESRRIRARVAEAEALAASLRVIDLRGRLERAVMAGTEWAGRRGRRRGAPGGRRGLPGRASDHPVAACAWPPRAPEVAGVPVAAAS